jgi:hypothetical protein
MVCGTHKPLLLPVQQTANQPLVTCHSVAGKWFASATLYVWQACWDPSSRLNSALAAQNPSYMIHYSAIKCQDLEYVLQACKLRSIMLHTSVAACHVRPCVAWMLSTLILAAYNVMYAYSTLYVPLYAVCTLLSKELATYWSKCHWKYYTDHVQERFLAAI